MGTETCYVQIQLPDTFEWVPCGILTVRNKALGPIWVLSITDADTWLAPWFLR